MKIEELIEKLCPEGVKYKSLEELGSFYGGITGKSKDDFVDGNAKFITYRNIYSNPSLKLNVEDRVKIASDEEQNTVQYGDVLFTGSSETPDECGISSVLTTKTDEKLYLNSFCFGFRLNDKSLFIPDFLKHLFRSTELRYQIGRTASGVTRFNVSKSKMKKVQIPIPPLEIQREIVKALDNFTELTAKLTAELTTELRARKQQYEYYREKLLNFEHDENIRHESLGNVVQFINGRAYKQEELLNSGKYKVLRVGNFFTNDSWYYSDLELSDDKYCNNGDLLYAWSASFGPRIWHGDKTIYHYHIWKLKFDENQIDKRFLFHFLANDVKNLRESTTGSTMVHISMTNMVKRKIDVPPVEKQKEIAAILDNFSKLCDDILEGLQAEIEYRKKQYEYYRDKLLTFKRSDV